MARFIGKTTSWAWWVLGLLAALIPLRRAKAQGMMQPMYGVSLRPISRPVLEAEQMRQAAALVDQYVARVEPTEPSPGVKARLDELVGQLASDDYQQREQASAEVVKLGRAALKALQAAAASEDREVAVRAGAAIAAIENRVRQPIVDRLKAISPAAVVAIGQQISAAQSATAAAEHAVFQAQWARDEKKLSEARAALAAAKIRLGLLMRLSGRIALPMNLTCPKYGVVSRYGVRPAPGPPPR